MKCSRASGAWMIVIVLSGCGEPKPAPRPKTVSDWLRNLESDDPTQRMEAAQQLGMRNPSDDAEKVVRALGQRVRDHDPGVRIAALSALGLVGPKAPAAAVSALIAALEQPDKHMRQMAAESIGKAGADAKEAVPALRTALNDTEQAVRQAAVIALGQLGPAAVPALVEGLQSPHEEVRFWCTQSLAGPEAGAAIPALIKLVDDPSERIRWAAVTSLGRVGAEAGRAGDVVPPLTLILTDDDAYLRMCAAEALGHLGPGGAPAVPTLIDAVRKEGPGRRLAAARALGRIGPKAQAALPALLEAMDDQTLDDHVTIAKAVWLIAGDADSVVPALIGVLQRNKTSSGVGSMNGPRSELATLQGRAIQLLGEMGSQARSAVPALRRIGGIRVDNQGAPLVVDPNATVRAPVPILGPSFSQLVTEALRKIEGADPAKEPAGPNDERLE